MAGNLIQSKSFRGVTGDKWLLKLEKKAFGWHFWSTATEDQVGFEVNSYGGHVTHKYIQWLEFRRPSPYTHNFLFILTEILDCIFSFFRKLLISIGFPLLIIALIIGIICRVGCNQPSMASYAFTIAIALAIAYACCIVGTLIFCGLGILWRKVFGIDEKLKQIYGDDLETACVFENEY